MAAQVHRTGKDHWVTSIKMRNRNISVYDSCTGKMPSITDSMKIQLSKIYWQSDENAELYKCEPAKGSTAKQCRRLWIICNIIPYGIFQNKGWSQKLPFWCCINEKPPYWLHQSETDDTIPEKEINNSSAEIKLVERCQCCIWDQLCRWMQFARWCQPVTIVENGSTNNVQESNQ